MVDHVIDDMADLHVHLSPMHDERRLLIQRVEQVLSDVVEHCNLSRILLLHHSSLHQRPSRRLEERVGRAYRVFHYVASKGPDGARGKRVGSLERSLWALSRSRLHGGHAFLSSQLLGLSPRYPFLGLRLQLHPVLRLALGRLGRHDLLRTHQQQGGDREGLQHLEGSDGSSRSALQGETFIPDSQGRMYKLASPELRGHRGLRSHADGGDRAEGHGEVHGGEEHQEASDKQVLGPVSRSSVFDVHLHDHLPYGLVPQRFLDKQFARPLPQQLLGDMRDVETVRVGSALYQPDLDQRLVALLHHVVNLDPVGMNF
mmetsp:Transcript_22447/g.73690  ORF Transcript_22447/g.73690 Transcript_22447/m.73690 type:complete len:315 (-) Transcript_22447:277-1221(-)